MTIKNDYRYGVELYRRESPKTIGELIGSAPIEVDWEPALNYCQFLGIRRGRLPAQLSIGNSAIVPIWSDSIGAPYMQGFRSSILADGNSKGFTSDFPNTYFGDLARRASADFVEQNKLKADERFFYLVTAFPAETPLSTGGPDRGGILVQEVPTPLPVSAKSLHALVQESQPVGTVADTDVPVFLHKMIIEEAFRRTIEAGSHETGGILIGYLHRDVSTPEIMVEVTAEVPAEHSRSELYSLSFTAHTWTAVGQTIRLRNKGEIMLGWWHSHSYLQEECKKCEHSEETKSQHTAVYMSAKDCALHRTVFSPAYSLALVIGNTGCNGLRYGLYGWSMGKVQARGFRILDGKGTEKK